MAAPTLSHPFGFPFPPYPVRAPISKHIIITRLLLNLHLLHSKPNSSNFSAQVQKDLMTSIVSTPHYALSSSRVALFSQIEQVSTLQQKRIGIFESPTGTGKSLSILCSTISWLQENSLADPCDITAGKIIQVQRFESIEVPDELISD